MLVKICGNRTIEDAMKSASVGADFCGILVGQKYASHDFVDLQTAYAIVNELKKSEYSSLPVMVTHETDPKNIADMARKIGVNIIQLHGSPAPQQIQDLKSMMPDDSIIITAVHVTTYEETLSSLLQYIETRSDYFPLMQKMKRQTKWAEQERRTTGLSAQESLRNYPI
jgi:phosphoribosylanthranilate isomerase